MSGAKWSIHIFMLETYENEIWERLWAQHSGVSTTWRCGYV